MPLFRGMKRWGVLLSALILSSLLLAACGESSPSVLNTQGPVAAKEAGLFWFILIVATIVFVIVEGLLIYSIIRYRERPGMPAPRQTHGNTNLEIIWTIAPSIFLFAVLIGTIYTMFNLSNISGTGRPVTVQVVGHQWWWEFDYRNEGFVTADEMRIPVDTVINVSLQSTNVIHSFWIQQLFLGAGGCQGCHGIVGVNLKDYTHLNGGASASLLVGPNLTHFGSRRTIAGGVLTWDPATCQVVTGSDGKPIIQNQQQCGLYQWLHDPQGVKPGNDMKLPSPLTDTQIAQLVAYLESLT